MWFCGNKYGDRGLMEEKGETEGIYIYGIP
jgi:hypothetical protein